MTIFDDNFPYTDFEQLNLDWIIDVVKTIQDEWENFDPDIYATAVEGTPANVTVTGDLLSGLTFHFTIPKGDTGATGVGIASTTLNPDYTLTFTYTDGSSYTTSSIRGATGETGNGIANAVLNADYTLTITYTDGTTYTTPSIRGQAGAGIITGGSTGQALVKASNTDYDTQWASVQEPLTAGTGIDITSGTISNQFATLVNPDLDTVKYNFQGYLYGGTNIPTGANNNGLLCSIFRKGTTDRGVQIYVPYNVDDMYFRRCSASVFQPWIKIQNSLTDSISAPDLDTLKTNLMGYVSNCTNGPSGVSKNGQLIIISGKESNKCLQIYTPADVNRLFFRKCYNDTWTTWAELSTI